LSLHGGISPHEGKPSRAIRPGDAYLASARCAQRACRGFAFALRVLPLRGGRAASCLLCRFSAALPWRRLRGCLSFTCTSTPRKLSDEFRLQQLLRDPPDCIPSLRKGAGFGAGLGMSALRLPPSPVPVEKTSEGGFVRDGFGAQGGLLRRTGGGHFS
jgi:hypothetical protein